jgi:hypothetical protein
VNLYLSGILGTTSTRVPHLSSSLKTGRYGLGPKPGTKALWIISSCISNLNLSSLSNLDLASQLPPLLILFLSLRLTPLHLLQPLFILVQLHHFDLELLRSELTIVLAVIRFRWAKHLRTRLRVPIIIFKFFFLSFVCHLECTRHSLS